MILAAAQTRPFARNTERNITRHVQLCALAATQGAQLILFPELSLTGYEREQGAALAFSEQDPRLRPLQEAAAQHQMTIIAGAPLRIGENLYIGAFVITPGKTLSVYTKQFLHSGEELYYTAGAAHDPLIRLDQEQVSLAICADIAHPEHPAHAAARGTTIYAAGIFYTPEGIAEAYTQLSGYARTHNMPVLMANYCGVSYGMNAAGKSGFWDRDGSRTGSAPEQEEGLLLARRDQDKWATTFLACPG